MDCPRCGATDVSSPECLRCGVILSRALPPRATRPPVRRRSPPSSSGGRLVLLGLGLALAAALAVVARQRRLPVAPAPLPPASRVGRRGRGRETGGPGRGPSRFPRVPIPRLSPGRTSHSTRRPSPAPQPPGRSAPGPPEPRALLARALESGDWGAAERAARDALAVAPSDSDAVRGLAYALVRQDRVARGDRGPRRLPRRARRPEGAGAARAHPARPWLGGGPRRGARRALPRPLRRRGAPRRRPGDRPRPRPPLRDARPRVRPPAVRADTGRPPVAGELRRRHRGARLVRRPVRLVRRAGAGPDRGPHRRGGRGARRDPPSRAHPRLRRRHLARRGPPRDPRGPRPADGGQALRARPGRRGPPRPGRRPDPGRDRLLPLLAVLRGVPVRPEGPGRRQRPPARPGRGLRRPVPRGLRKEP